MISHRLSSLHRATPPLLILLGMLASPGLAQSLSLQQVSQKLENARAKVDNLKARAQFAFDINLGILPYSDRLDGLYFFKKPDRHRFDFPDAPSYLKSLPSMFSWKLPGVEKYDAKVTGPILEDGKRIYELFYTAKNAASKTADITVIVDAKAWRVVRQDTHYRDGGSVLLSFAYREVDKMSLMERVSGKLDIPSYKVKGTAVITLSGHLVNRGVDDSVFNAP